MQIAGSISRVEQSWGDLTAQCNIVLPHVVAGGKWCLYMSITSHEAGLQVTLEYCYAL